MATNVLEQEEVKKESQDALLDKVKDLETKLATAKASEDEWYKNYVDIKNKYERFKNAVKSVAMLVD